MIGCEAVSINKNDIAIDKVKPNIKNGISMSARDVHDGCIKLKWQNSIISKSTMGKIANMWAC
eukprot:scaffold466519_cov41-Prasinocladus_malaysianus.AAC.1